MFVDKKRFKKLSVPRTTYQKQIGCNKQLNTFSSLKKMQKYTIQTSEIDNSISPNIVCNTFIVYEHAIKTQRDS